MPLEPNRKTGVILLCLCIAGILPAGCQLVWTRLPYYETTGGDPGRLAILSDEEYDAVIETHPRPFVVELTGGGGALVLFGATHTKDPDDPQIADIERRWTEFEPTVALCESRLGTMFVGLMDPVETFSEPGAVHALARRSDIPTYTWEPPEDAVTDRLLQEYDPEQVALSLILRPYFSNLRFGKPDDPEDFVEEFIEPRTEHPELHGSIRSVEDIDRIWRRDFADVPDWRDTSDEWGLPGYLAGVASLANRARDEHFAQVILDLIRQGERVFAVAGSSHAVKLEPALTQALGSDDAGGAP